MYSIRAQQARRREDKVIGLRHADLAIKDSACSEAEIVLSLIQSTQAFQEVCRVQARFTASRQKHRVRSGQRHAEALEEGDRSQCIANEQAVHEQGSAVCVCSAAGIKPERFGRTSYESDSEREADDCECLEPDHVSE